MSVPAQATTATAPAQAAPAQAVTEAVTQAAAAPAPETTLSPEAAIVAATEVKPAETEPSKPAEVAPAPEQPVVPEKYDLKLGEGSLLDPARVAEVEAFAKANKLSQEAAQGLLDREQNAVVTFAQAQAASLKQKVEVDWPKQIEADKELGGQMFKENMELAKRVVAKFGTDTFKTVLNETGLGNHPELVRLLARIGKEFAPQTLVVAGAQAGDQKRIEDIFYPNMKKD